MPTERRLFTYGAINVYQAFLGCTRCKWRASWNQQTITLLKRKLILLSTIIRVKTTPITAQW